MKEIICTGGEIVKVDDEDYPLLSRHWWAYMKNQKHPYVVTTLNTTEGSKKTIMLHNMIMGFSRYVDHVDNDPLNNQKENLRPATHQQNGWNKGKNTYKKKTATSKYKGVMYAPLRGRDRWVVLIKHVEEGAHKSTGKTIRCGYFWDEIEAAKAYNKKIIELRGPWAWVNPIPSTPDSPSQPAYHQTSGTS